MGYFFDRDDLAFLRSAGGTAALVEVAELELSTRTHLADVATVRARFGERGAALVETVLLRRRAAGKLADPGRWLLTDEALQQATPTAVARHRAERLAGRSVHDVTCSIGAELDALTATCPQVLGSDLDRVRLDMARTNVPAATVFRADALTSTSRGTVVLADPARRAGGTRRFDPAGLMPPLPDLLAVHRDRDLVVKCAPGLDFDRLDWPGEVELVSLNGRVREACLWSEGLTEPGVHRRATVLGADGRIETITDALPDVLPEREPGQWLIDPDGAIVRAGLVRHYGAAHGLWQLDPRIAYLTGDEVPAGVRGFRILERLKYSEKSLRQELARRDCGILEILVRGLDVDPDALRRRMKPRGSSALSVVLTRIGRTPTAFICRV